MRRIVLLAVAVTVCLIVLAGCACSHEWVEADCLNAKTCTRCQQTEGESLGHTPGDWAETAHVITAEIERERICQVCGAQTDRESLTMDTMIREEMFAFTPAEFMDRLTYIAGQHGDALAWEFSYSDIGLQVMVVSDEKEALIQFFHGDTTALNSNEEDSPVVWCVNLSQINDPDPDLRLYFLMACDPSLNKDAAAVTDGKLTEAMGSAEEIFGYYQEHQLLYEVFYIQENVLGQSYSLNMLNIYASDFR